MPEDTIDFVLKDTETPPTDSEKGSEGQTEYRLPKINFSTFILSLNSSVLVHLGIIEDPATGIKSKNAALAKQTIDLLAMLEEKTKGNLTAEEEKMLKGILYDLRMNFVRGK